MILSFWSQGLAVGYLVKHAYNRDNLQRVHNLEGSVENLQKNKWSQYISIVLTEGCMTSFSKYDCYNLKLWKRRRSFDAAEDVKMFERVKKCFSMLKNNNNDLLLTILFHANKVYVKKWIRTSSCLPVLCPLTVSWFMVKIYKDNFSVGHNFDLIDFGIF